MPHSYLRIAAGALLAGSVACGVVDSLRLRGGPPARGPVPQPGRMPGDLGGQPADPMPRTPGTGATPGSAGDTRYPGTRQVCRTSAPPRGWIAIAYVSGSGECPARRGADSVATAAVLVRYADHAVGTELDVCADQVVPQGWAMSRDEAADGDQCPGATRGDGPTSKRIRRVQ